MVRQKLWQESNGKGIILRGCPPNPVHSCFYLLFSPFSFEEHAAEIVLRVSMSGPGGASIPEDAPK